MNKKNDFRTPLAKATALGSAKSGTGHFWHQRVTALLNLVLLVFFVFALTKYLGQGYDKLHHVFRCSIVCSFVLLMIISGIYHMKLGMQIVIEDYIHCHKLRALLLIINMLLCSVIAIACILSVFKINFGG